MIQRLRRRREGGSGARAGTVGCPDRSGSAATVTLFCGTSTEDSAGGDQAEVGIVGEDGTMQLLQRRAGLDAQLGVQQLVQLAVFDQRVGLPPAPVEGKHALRMRLLAKRLPSDQLVGLGNRRSVVT